MHPREPKKKTQGAHKTYYHVKDIAYLAHEALLVKFREQRAYDRKITRARAKSVSEERRRADERIVTD